MASSGAGDGSVPRYIDPGRVYQLYINRKADDLLDYIDSFPGAAHDDRCNEIKKLLKYLRVPGQGQLERFQAHHMWAQFAWKLARQCSLAAPENVIDLANITSYPVLDDHLVLPAMLNQPSAPNSEIPAAAAKPSAGVLPLHQPQPEPEQFSPQEVMQNAQGIRIRPASLRFLSLPKEERIVRLSVASLIAPDGTLGSAGWVMRDGKGQYICAECLPIPKTELASVFAAACHEALTTVRSYDPTAVVLESHLIPLLQSTHPEVEALKARLRQAGCRISQISEGSNGPACQMARHAQQTGRLLQKPDWLVLN